ncbi:MAG: hypothetical protein DWQ47_07270 [Acidobacteria bacterium]|nr:MAG: hypothetical protein DWQ32_15370 [Acidobacteriota bacterium]REJ99274.1 MAG: hypothetical protein DWQ38_14605 [Acidobacteriota bacterium]REK16005.1 MAG: hypothetical protein DWQ43_03080 [Acidobacteriota bacterium]REK43686.1 MAG: hypothetical protein DWQ47_07270 [Acidobacteriota bacterium]
MLYSRILAISFLIIVSVLPASVSGQGTSGTIEGVITDQHGAVIPGARVRVKSGENTTGSRFSTVTNRSGRFIVADVYPGWYEITVSKADFQDMKGVVLVAVDDTAVFNRQLQVAVQEPYRVIIDSTVQIDPANTMIDTNITQRLLDDLPKGTNISSTFKFAANVRPEALSCFRGNEFGSECFQIDGASGAENVFVVDGQEVTNLGNGLLADINNLPVELAQEVQIRSTGFNAEYGGAIGGMINVVTAGGNNDWHGNLGIGFRPNKFQGAPNLFINLNSSPSGELRYFRPNKDGGTHFFPSASISGPIVKDRLWGLMTYAPQLRKTNRTIDFYSDPSNPTPQSIIRSDTFVATTTNQYAFSRIDAQPIESVRVFGTFLWNPRADNGEFPHLDTWDTRLLSPNPPPITSADYAKRGGRRNSNSYNAQATWIPYKWMVVNFRTGRSFENSKLRSYGLPTGTRFAVSTDSLLDPCNSGEINIPEALRYCRGFNTGPNHQVLWNVSTRTTYDADVTFVGIDAAGRHNVKTGWQLNGLFNDAQIDFDSDNRYVLLYYGVELTAFSGVVPIPLLPLCDFQNIDPNDSNCSLGTARVVRRGIFGKAGSDNIALFAQDSWTIKDRITVNYGLRAESEIVPSFPDPATTTDLDFGWGDKLAPRLGVALDLFGTGRTKVFGSYGWFYDRFKYNLPRKLFGGEIFQDGFAQIVPSRGLTPFDYTVEAMLGGRGIIRGNECPITSGNTGYVECELDRVVPVNAVDANPFVGDGAVDPDLEAMRQSEYTIGMEQEIGNNFLLAARFTHKQLDQAIEDIGTLNDQGQFAWVIGNPGEGLACEIARTGNLPCTDEKRTYDAVEIRVDKRAQKYFFNANYTWSRLYGNYSGHTNSDLNGQIQPNLTSVFDLPSLGWTANGEPDDGLLQTDRTHVFKAFGGYTFNWFRDRTNQTTVSGFTTIQSGTPVTTQYTLRPSSFGRWSFGRWSVLFGRGDLGRTEVFTETDLAIRHTYRFGRDNRFSVEPYIEIRNIFDERNEVGRYQLISIIAFSQQVLQAAGCDTCDSPVGVLDTIFNGGGIEQFVLAHLEANPTDRSNAYKHPWLFQAPRDVRFGFKFAF